jgi:hypothetical protein
MIKRPLLLFCFILTATLSKAQVTDTVLLNKLGDFDIANLNNDAYGALIIGESILPDTAKIPEKARINFFAKLAKDYDDTEQDDKATYYYEKVSAAEPNYYVAQRALGYLYNEKAEDIQLKLYITPKDDPAYQKIYDDYAKAVRKALPHLEKAQACDPDDDTLDLIKTLYMNLHDEGALKTLINRLPDLSQKCVDVLEDK